MGRALTGNMPDDSSVEDFHVFTAGLSTFVRRKSSFSSFLSPSSLSNEKEDGLGTSLAQGTQLLRPGTDLGVLGVPNWKNGKGVGGGWDCVVNGDCRFLSTGAERGWLVFPYLLSLFFSFVVVALFTPFYLYMTKFYDLGTSTEMNPSIRALWMAHHLLLKFLHWLRQVYRVRNYKCY